MTSSTFARSVRHTVNFGRSQCLHGGVIGQAVSSQRLILAHWTVAKQWRLPYSQPRRDCHIVCGSQIETSKVFTLLSTKTSYNDDVRWQQDERGSDVQKSTQTKTVKLAKNVEIIQEHLSMRQRPNTLHLVCLRHCYAIASKRFQTTVASCALGWLLRLEY